MLPERTRSASWADYMARFDQLSGWYSRFERRSADRWRFQVEQQRKEKRSEEPCIPEV
jgi:hypothetical protein